jgi:hypothetical protein
VALGCSGGPRALFRFLRGATLRERAAELTGWPCGFFSYMLY